MIGVPLIGLAFGEAGLVTLFTLISVHALVLLTGATVVFELAAARESAPRRASPTAHAAHGAAGGQNAHPAPGCRCPSSPGCCLRKPGWCCLPWSINPATARSGAGAAGTAAGGRYAGVLPKIGSGLWPALRIALVKSLLFPLVLAVLGLVLGFGDQRWRCWSSRLRCPSARTFLFAQRYDVAEAEVTASIAVSTAMALVTLPVVMYLVARFVAV